MRPVVLLLLLVSVSCQTAQFVPADFSDDSPESTALGLRASDKQLYLEHMPTDQKQVIIDMEIINESGESFFLAPEKMILFMSNEPFPIVDMDNQTELAVSHVKQYGGWGPVKARSAKEVNQFIKRRIRAQRAGQVAMLVLGTALVVSDAVADSKDAKKEVVTQRDVDRAVMRDAATLSALALMDFAGNEMENGIIRRYEDLEFLPEEYLGPQLLLPGSSARGKVFFPKRDHRYYRIIMSIDGVSYTFDFRYPTSRERKALRRNMR